MSSTPHPAALDLRSFLRQTCQETPEEFLYVRDPISDSQEPNALVKSLEASGRTPILYFSQVGNHRIPVVTNVHATRARLARSLNTSESALNERYQSGINQGIEPVTVSSGPVQEVVALGDHADLGSLPFVTPSALTPAPYLGGGIFLTRDLDSGIRNLSFNRLMVRGPRRMTFHPAPGLHADAILRKAAQGRRDLPVAIIIGYHPSLALGTLAKVPFGVDELACCGGLTGAPVPLVSCVSIPLEVPAFAEVVIEGVVRYGEKDEEGPYDEFTGYALPAEQNPVLTVTAITHRTRPIWQDIFGGGVEHLLLGSIPKSASLEMRLKMAHPEVVAVHYPLSGCGRFHAVVSLREHDARDVRRIMMTALSMDHFLKHVWIVDADIDVASDRDVLWTMATCFQANRDALIIERLLGSSLDPSAKDSIGTKGGFDCTRKGADFPPRNTVDSALISKMSAERWSAPLPNPLPF